MKRTRARPRSRKQDSGPAPPVEPTVAAELDAAKRASSAQLLIRCARLLNERGLARAAARFGVPIRASHLSVFPHLDLDGTRQTELARRMGISKQAVHQIVGELETFGVVCREPDPSDGRATLVRFTSAGARSLLDGMAVLAELDVELAERIGTRHARALHAALTAVNAWLSEPS